MTRILSHRFLFIFSIFFLGLVACHEDKPTIINGTIIDAATGSIMESVSITYGVYANGESHGIFTINSDTQGKFSISLTQDEGISGLEMQKTGYVTKSNFGSPYAEGQINELAIMMHPVDGTLRLNLENISGQNDTVYIGVYSPILDSEMEFSNGVIAFEKPPIPFNMGTIYSKDISLASGQKAQIYWSFDKPPASISLFSYAPFRDSVAIQRNEIVPYNISF